jgi:hypothetical protein
MDAETGIGVDSAASIREQIDQTRHALGQKIESLEGEVRGVVGDISQTVSEKVATIRRAVDISERVRAYPKAACFAAVAVGVLVGRRPRHKSFQNEEQFAANSPIAGQVRGQLVRASLPVVIGLVQGVGRQVLTEWLSRRAPPKGENIR